LQKEKWEVLQHPPYSPDLAPSDFYLFGPFKNFLSRKRFEDQNTLQKTVVQYFTSLGREHYHEGMSKLVKRWDKCIRANGDYMEK
jgi:histone-lysine N-methyltransferase SETMAR